MLLLSFSYKYPSNIPTMSFLTNEEEPVKLKCHYILVASVVFTSASNCNVVLVDNFGFLIFLGKSPQPHKGKEPVGDIIRTLPG
jgi:hypothetical protein